jgi:hypothetical protein
MSIGQLVQSLAQHKAAMAAADEARPIGDVVRRIANRHHNLARFWSKVAGWAPGEAAAMLSKSRLDRLTALAGSLRRWVETPEPLDEGDLILAWANLGALVDGLLKLHLSVYLRDYKADVATGKASNAFHVKKQLMLDPDGLRLDVLITFHEKRKLLTEPQLELVRLVQQRRNVIHAFKDAELGDTEDFLAAVRAYRRLLTSISKRLPYPDDVFEPTEQGPF